jgi:hypothetical protein
MNVDPSSIGRLAWQWSAGCTKASAWGISVILAFFSTMRAYPAEAPSNEPTNGCEIRWALPIPTRGRHQTKRNCLSSDKEGRWSTAKGADRCHGDALRVRLIPFGRELFCSTGLWIFVSRLPRKRKFRRKYRAYSLVMQTTLTTSLNGQPGRISLMAGLRCGAGRIPA